jgi:hypothetical protein
MFVLKHGMGKQKIPRELTDQRDAPKLEKLFACRGSSLVERRPEKAGVASSILAPGTISLQSLPIDPTFLTGITCVVGGESVVRCGDASGLWPV